MKLRPATHRKDGIIRPGRSKLARELDFTPEKFNDTSFLWKIGEYIYISFIESRNPGEGHFSQLLKNIYKKGYGVKVPNPFPSMKEILEKKGFIQTYETNPKMGDEPIEVYVSEVEV